MPGMRNLELESCPGQNLLRARLRFPDATLQQPGKVTTAETNTIVGARDTTTFIEDANRCILKKPSAGLEGRRDFEGDLEQGSIHDGDAQGHQPAFNNPAG